MHAITKTLPAFIVRLENSALGLYGFPQVNTGKIKSTRIGKHGRAHEMLYSDRYEIEVVCSDRVTLLLVAVTTFFKDAKQVREVV